METVVLMFFWIKITIKRILGLLKSSPLIIIWATLIIGSFVYAFANRHISINLNPQVIAIIIPFLVLSALLNSFKVYNVIPELIKYSKSKYSNTGICIKFYAIKAVLNNALLLPVNIIAYYSSMEKKYIAIIFIITSFSIILSFLLMYFRNKYGNKRIKKITINRSRINPLIKYTLYDYLVPNFLALAIFCAALFLVIIVELAKNFETLNDLEDTYFFFCLLTIIFAIGLTGIIESIANINWKFQAIISPNDFKYHLKRTILFLAGTYIGLLISFIIIGYILDVSLTLKYLYCIFVMFFISINVGFTISSILTKSIVLLSFAALTIWISTLSFGFLPVLAIPVIISFFKAKSEYREWYLI